MNRELTEQEEEIFQLLKGVIDPELMVNIIDLGLVYDVRIDEKSVAIEVDMTLTSPGCPLGEVIMEDVDQVVKNNFNDYSVKVNLLWEPMWTLDRLTQEGKEALGRT